MSLVEKIKHLCEERKVSVAELERNTGISNGQIRKWDDSTPGVDKLNLIADYFNVSTDFLLGRTDKRNYYELTEKDEKNIQKDLEQMLNNLSSDSGYAASDGNTISDLDEEDRELLVSSLEQSLRIAKRLAKQKFTPKKYRN